jgi:hypothetical protein
MSEYLSSKLFHIQYMLEIALFKQVELIYSLPVFRAYYIQI